MTVLGQLSIQLQLGAFPANAWRSPLAISLLLIVLCHTSSGSIAYASTNDRLITGKGFTLDNRSGWPTFCKFSSSLFSCRLLGFTLACSVMLHLVFGNSLLIDIILFGNNLK